MKKILTLALLTLSSVAVAQSTQYPNSTATIWAPGTTTGDLNFVTSRVTSGTTAANFGTVFVDPSVQNRVIFTANDTAVSSLVTSTITLKLKGKTVGTVSSVSATSLGNVITLPKPGYFDALSVSVTVPSAISATNSLQITVTGE